MYCKRLMVQIVCFPIVSFLMFCSPADNSKALEETDFKVKTSQVDRHIGIVKVDTLKYYLKLAMSDVDIVQNGKKTLRVFTSIQKRSVFYRNILGQELEDGNQSILELLKENNSKYKDKWRSISDDSIYGFESDLYEEDSDYAYVPYEILIQLNTNRKIK